MTLGRCIQALAPKTAALVLFVGAVGAGSSCSTSARNDEGELRDASSKGGEDGGAGASGATGSGGSSASGGATGSGGMKAGNGGTKAGGGQDAGASGGRSGAGGAGGSSSASGGASNVVTPPTTWVNATGDLATQAAGGGDVSIVAAKPGSTRVIVGVGKKGLWATDDAGKTWVHLGQGAGSATIDNGPTAIVFDPDHPDTFWESGIYGSTGGVFRTTDDGVTFERLGDISHNDLVSVDFSDPDRKTLLAGAHETSRKLFLSKDGGETWSDIGMSLPADSNFSSAPQIIDTKTFLLGSCGYGSGACGIFRSADGGTSWTRAATQGAVNRPLWTSKKAFYWTLIYDRGVVASQDGQTWTETGTGPVQNMSGPLTELPDGRVVALGKTHLLVTKDGKTWTEIGDALPFPGANCGTYGFAYSAATKTFFINHNDCKGAILPTSVYRAGFDYAKQ